MAKGWNKTKKEGVILLFRAVGSTSREGLTALSQVGGENPANAWWPDQNSVEYVGTTKISEWRDKTI